MKFKDINGMEAARYIAAMLLTDSSYKGEKYYEKEDELTSKIEKCLDNLKLDSNSEYQNYYKLEKQFHMEDINNRLEERNREADESDKQMILEYYEDWSSENDDWVYRLDEAINKVLGDDEEEE